MAYIVKKGTPKTSDILNMSGNELRKLSKSDLIEYAKRVVNTANKRITNIRKADAQSPALGYLERELSFSNQGKINVNTKMSRNEIIKTLVSSKNYLERKTSSLTGLRKVEKEFQTRLNIKKGSEFDKKRFWDLYSKFQEEFGSKVNNVGSNEVQIELKKILTKDKSDADMLSELDARINELYEQKTEFETSDELPFS